ncbi:hypothetical protein PtA15_8A433 [Puccinia triticina]|uniref:Uncharacterized protein n=1 Tax=Puccinia triticina TaxID=208348 RepID=A0ABY7CQP4_9BASI|nr:uncharacterized protein PtA15_8A433 [Puccinia triticina]WAQ87529.1 hypothetical protein PtA15_8A433 [Puccinia triticina]
MTRKDRTRIANQTKRCWSKKLTQRKPLVPHCVPPNIVTHPFSGLINQALGNLVKKYNRIDLRAASREPPWDVDEEEYVDDNWRFARKEVLSINQLDTQKAHLVQFQTSFLPALKQQLEDLLKSLDIADLPKTPTPKLLDTLEITSRLSHTSDQINNFLRSVAPIAVNPLHTPENYDHNYGGLKKYRVSRIIDKTNDLMRGHVSQLFHRCSTLMRAFVTYSKNPPISLRNQPDLIALGKNVIKGTALSSDEINSIIKWSAQSDFSILQARCHSEAEDLGYTLGRLTAQIDPKRRVGPWCGGFSGESYENPWSTSEDESDENESSETDQAGTESLDEHEDTQSHSNPSSEHESTQSSSSLSPGLSVEFSFTPRFIRLSRSTIPLMKLLRIFFNKLSNARTSKPPFTIGTTMSSTEINAMDDEIGGLACSISNLMNTLFYMYDSNADMDSANDLRNLHGEISRCFDSSMILLCCYLHPLTPQDDDLPLSGNMFKTWFLELRQQTRLALDHFRSALYSFEK